jgi:hypothetical protein
MSATNPTKQRTRNSAHADDLPHALTFFLTERERRAVLTTLKRHGKNRARALLNALNLKLSPPDHSNAET